MKPGKNDLPFVTLFVCLLGFLIMCLVGYLAEDLIVRKFSERSPLFVEYSYLVYPFAFLMLIFIWLESFSWSFKKGVASNTVKEAVPRICLTILLLAFSVNLFNLPQFFVLFSISYALPVLILFLILRKTRQFKFVTNISPVTRRLKPKMVNFGLFIFGAQFLNLLSRTVDTFILSSKSDRGLEDAAVFTIATYIVTIMEVPQRSITSITIPVLAELWKNKDTKRIANIYSKSVSNLLPIGLGMFGLIWLNTHNLEGYLGEDYTGIHAIILFMGIGTLIDLGTGANSQIIATSNYWKVDFTTTVIYTLIALPLNYILIDYFGLMGAAYSYLISRAVFNAMRFGFLWYKFGLQPYTAKNFLAVFIAIVATILAYVIPKMSSIVIDAAIRSLVFLSVFLPTIYFAKVSEEINGMIKNIIRRMGFRI